MRYSVYVLKDKNGKRYTGYTGDLEKRLLEHNNKLTKTTSRGNNWELIYKESYNTKTEAIKREKYLKTGKGRDFIKQQCGIV